MSTEHVNPALRSYVEREIIPRYDLHDKAHRRDHVEYVIGEALRLAAFYDVDADMVYVAAAYHDTGLCKGRKTHHLVSGEIIRSASELRKFFTPEQVEIVAQAAEDHRASGKNEPRSIYGKLISEADRQIDAEVTLRRIIQYGLANFPSLNKEEQWLRTLEHLHEKYADGGYLKLWIPESPNKARLAAFRELIRDEVRLRPIFNEIYDQLSD